MKRRDEREGVLDAKPCDWQAAKGQSGLGSQGSAGKDGLCCHNQFQHLLLT